MSVQDRFNDMHLSLSEVGALAAMLEAWFDDQDWGGVDEARIEQAALTIRMLARTARFAVAKASFLETALADAQFSEPGEWDLPAEPKTRP